MVTGSAEPVKTLTLFGQEISQPASVESKDGDGYFDGNEIRQSGVIGAGILSALSPDVRLRTRKIHGGSGQEVGPCVK